MDSPNTSHFLLQPLDLSNDFGSEGKYHFDWDCADRKNVFRTAIEADGQARNLWGRRMNQGALDVVLADQIGKRLALGDS